MPRRLRPTVALLAALLCFPAPFVARAGEREAKAPPAKTRAAIERAVLETHDRILQAARELRADANQEFMADTATGALVSGGRLFLTREAATRSFREAYAGLKSQEVTVHSRHVTTLAPTVALVVADVEGVATALDGRQFAGRSLQSVVFTLVDGEWKVAHAHQSRVVP